jgi:hypothetical protein
MRIWSHVRLLTTARMLSPQSVLGTNSIVSRKPTLCQ